jgi:hypothetical protein
MVMLDVRFPIGALFFILGILIGAWGYTHPVVSAFATKIGPMPINFDIIWGILMTIFGVAMFSLAKLDEAVAMERELKEEKAKASALELAAVIAAAPQEEMAGQKTGEQPSEVAAEKPSESAAEQPSESAAEKQTGTTDGADKGIS